MKDKGFQEEKVALTMVFQTMKEKERRDLAAAKSSTDSTSTQPCLPSTWSSSFKGAHDFKDIMTTGLADNIWDFSMIILC